MTSMFEYSVLGIIQGVAEWLPVSSEGWIVLIKTHFFPSSQDFTSIVRQALFLHFGTFLAALVYFRRDVMNILGSLRRFRHEPRENRNLLTFLAISTLISGTLGLLLIKGLARITSHFESTGKVLTACVGLLLLGTAFLEFKAKKGGHRDLKNITLTDGILLGLAQGFAALPGLSRSGLTVSSLLLRRFDKACALKLSFLMSLPIVLAGNIVLNLNQLSFSKEALAGLFFSFIFGLGTIHLLLKIAEKIQFGYFLLIFSALTLTSVFL